MAKGKSSASSATRKKHARKAVAHTGEAEEPAVPKEKKPKGKEKGSKKNKEPRKKIYIPPVKPAPVQPDPLDTLGIAQNLPPELLVVLRRLAKKDSITKRRALEELQSDWVNKARVGGAERELSALVESLPVWLHHVPALFLHSSRRIRLLAVCLHTSLLDLPSPVPDQLFFYLREVADADQAEYILGTWCMAVHDVDRQVSSFSRRSWDKCISVFQTSAPASATSYFGSAQRMNILLSRLWAFVQRTILDPGGVYLYVNPPQPPAPLPPPRKEPGRSAQPVRQEDDSVGRAKGEEEGESETDRKARLRIGALGAAQWVLNMYVKIGQATKDIDEIVAPLNNAALWSALYHGPSAPFISEEMESFGYNQPGVRKAAWSLLECLLTAYRGHLQALFPTLSIAALRSAWLEPDSGVRFAMWIPLITLLKDCRNAWELAAASTTEADEGEEESGSEDEPNGQTVLKAEAPSTVVNADRSKRINPAYQEFLQFLELGCSGSPIEGYPSVFLILAYLPLSVIASSDPPLQTVFTSFWAAVDGRALSGLDRAAASAAFLSSLLECTLHFVRVLAEESAAQLLAPDDADPARTLVNEQVQRMWEELSGGKLKVEESKAGGMIAETLIKLERFYPTLFDAAWDTLSVAIRSQLTSFEKPIPPLIRGVLKIFQEKFEEGTRPANATKSLILEVVHTVISQFEDILLANENVAVDQTRLTSLVEVLDMFGKELFDDEELAQAVDEALMKNTYRLLSISPRIIFVYLSHRQDETMCSRLWHGVLEAIASHPDNIHETLPPLLDAAEKGELPSYLQPSGDELDKLVGNLLTEALTDERGMQALDIVQRIMKLPDHFIARCCFQGLIAGLGAAFLTHAQNTLHDDSIPLKTFTAPLTLLSSVMEADQFIYMPPDTSLSLLPDVFFFAFLLPHFRKVDPLQKQLSESFWEMWLSQASESLKLETVAIIKQRLRDLLLDCSALPTPLHILRVIMSHTPGLHFDVMGDIFPQKRELDAMLDVLPSDPTDTSLAVLDPLILPGSLESDSPGMKSVVDSWGYSSFARVAVALLHYLTEDRQAGKNNVWALRHLIALAQYADEVLQIPSLNSAVFGEQIAPTDLADIVLRVQQLTAYLLSSSSDETWLSRTIAAILEGKPPSPNDGLAQLLNDLIRDPQGRDTSRESRTLHTMLQHLLGSATKTEADQLIILSRKIESKAPHTALAIILSVTRYAPEPPRLERYRNELAAGLLGIPASKANVTGLWHLRRLAATAPDLESDVVFLPTPRAVNVMKVCQQWVTSDEEIDEEVESEMTLIFLYLAPILQNVPGSHWDFIFDVMENNLENCSLAESSTLPTLSRTSKLLIAVQDLSSTNKSLRALWHERQMTILTLVRDLVAVKLSVHVASAPLSICRELAISIVQDLPESLIDQDTLPKMCHLVTDPSADVQKMAYHMLRGAAAKRTEYVVVEAAMDTETVLKPQLPLELVDLLQRSLPNDEDVETHENLFGNLLAWMLTFDLFTNASLKVKSGYIDHLRQLDLIADYFLPQILSILGLYNGISKAFKLGIWAVDEYYIDLYSPQSSCSLPLLAAHLYYRALLVIPSLFRSWLLDCRDRQLSTAVTTYTSNYFSPAIVHTELAQLKDPVVAADLADENMKVKVASAVNEITASYAVDEYQLELKLKLPSDWPLHGVEVKDTARIGVSEERWRAWILGVQQILTFRNGSLVDGLSFFKKNVTSHFEGKTECPICYSMISAMDGTLPNKPCKTCKNRYHAGCLYKWFNTSHSSSCPLCRSEIMQ